MKKLLLSLAMVLGFVAAQASVVTIEPADWEGKWTGDGNGFTATINGVKISTDKASSNNDLLEPDDKSIRVYAGAEITISAESPITSIVFTTGASSKAGNLTYSDGWTGDGSVASGAGHTITITSDGLTSMMMHTTGQVRIAKIEVTIDGEVTPDPIDPDPVDPDPVDPDPVDPDPVDPDEDGEVVVLTSQFTTVPGANVIGGYTFDFEKNNGGTAPRLNDDHLRLYAKNSMTVSGKKVTKIVITLNAGNSQYTSFEPSTGAYNTPQAADDTELTWTGNASSVTFTVGDKAIYSSNTAKAGQIHIAKITVYGEPGEGGDVPPTPSTDVAVVKATEVVAGQVAFVFPEGYVSTFEESKDFGYWMATSTTVADQMTVAKEAIFTLEEAAEGYTITDCYDRYMGWDGSHWSVNAYTTPDKGHCYWTAEMVDGKIKLTNTADYEGAEVFLGGKTYNNKYEMCPSHNPEDALPYLYVIDTTVGISEIISNEDAPVVYYNLQGVQVENPSAGLYIRRQGNKTTKVLVK